MAPTWLGVNETVAPRPTSTMTQSSTITPRATTTSIQVTARRLGSQPE